MRNVAAALAGQEHDSWPFCCTICCTLCCTEHPATYRINRQVTRRINKIPSEAKRGCTEHGRKHFRVRAQARGRTAFAHLGTSTPHATESTLIRRRHRQRSGLSARPFLRRRERQRK